nr:MAG TPA: hypothetical protein [Caudoviricetes sp.]
MVGLHAANQNEHNITCQSETSEARLRSVHRLILGGRSPPIHTYIHTLQRIVVFILK